MAGPRCKFVCIPPDKGGNIALNAGKPRIGLQPAHGRKLAICGGGPSLHQHLDELRAFDGDIWACNLTGQWLGDQGISSIAVTVDPKPKPAFKRHPLVKGALFASCVSPDRFEQYPDAQVFDLVEDLPPPKRDPDKIYLKPAQHPPFAGVAGGSSTASRIPLLAVMMGYRDISFFGCDGSFAERTHSDRSETQKELMIIEAGGQKYLTSPSYYCAAQELAETISSVPEVFKCRSAGLLAAMLADPDWSVIAVSDALKTNLETHSGFVQYQQRYTGEVPQCSFG